MKRMTSLNSTGLFPGVHTPKKERHPELSKTVRYTSEQGAEKAKRRFCSDVSSLGEIPLHC